MASLALLATHSGGCKSNVGTIAVEILVSPDPSERPLRAFAADVRVRVTDGDEELASRTFPVDSGEGVLGAVPVGQGRQIVVEGLDPEGRVVSRGRSVPMSIEGGTNQVAVFVGRLNAFSLTPAEDRERAAGSTDAATDGSVGDGSVGDGSAGDGSAGDGSAGDGSADSTTADGGDTDASVDASSPADAKAPEADTGARPSSRTSALRTARAFHRATRLADGTLLLSGGAVSTTWRPELSQSAPEATASAELLDQSALRRLTSCDEATGVGCLQQARVGHTATALPSGNVLIAGGRDGEQLVSEVEIFDLVKRSSFFGPQLSAERHGHAAATSGGQVVLAGGEGRSAALSSVERYDLEITAAPQMRDARRAFALVGLKDGTLLAIGGFDRRGAPLRGTEFLKPGAPSWTSGPLLKVGRAYPRAVLLDGDRVLIVGGLAERAAGGCARRDAASCVGATAVELLDGLSSPQTKQVGELNVGRWAHSVTRLTDGRVMVAGGFAPNLGGAPAASTEEIRITDALVHIKQGRSMRLPRAGHSATLLDSGFLLVVGGVSVGEGTLTLESSAEVFVY